MLSDLILWIKYKLGIARDGVDFIVLGQSDSEVMYE